jgi:hypothetical protein
MALLCTLRREEIVRSQRLTVSPVDSSACGGPPHNTVGGDGFVVGCTTVRWTGRPFPFRAPPHMRARVVPGAGGRPARFRLPTVVAGSVCLGASFEWCGLLPCFRAIRRRLWSDQGSRPATKGRPLIARGRRRYDQVTGESNAVGRASNSSKHAFEGRALSLERQILSLAAWLGTSGADQTKARSWLSVLIISIAWRLHS